MEGFREKAGLSMGKISLYSAREIFYNALRGSGSVPEEGPALPIAEGKEELWEKPNKSASAPASGRGRRGEGRIEGFGGCPSVPLRVRTQPVNMRVTAKQRGWDRGTRCKWLRVCPLV